MTVAMTWMNKLADFFSTYVVSPFTTIVWTDFLDIALLAIILYLVLRFVRDRRAWTLLVGFAALGAFYFLTWLLDLRATYTILHAFFSMYIVFIIVIFQRELRDALEKIGGTILQLRHLGYLRSRLPMLRPPLACFPRRRAIWHVKNAVL